MINLMLFQLIFWFSFAAHATEIDNYYPRTVELKDSLTSLNALFNYRLGQAEKWVASKSGCGDFHLREAVWRYIGGKLWSKFEIDINRLKMFDTIVPSVEDS